MHCAWVSTGTIAVQNYENYFGKRRVRMTAAVWVSLCVSLFLSQSLTSLHRRLRLSLSLSSPCPIAFSLSTILSLSPINTQQSHSPSVPYSSRQNACSLSFSFTLSHSVCVSQRKPRAQSHLLLPYHSHFLPLCKR